MSYSFNETEALCRKAARGAGFSWGMAEEAGRAARWLKRHGLGGAAALVDLLQTIDGKPFAQIAPSIGETWQAKTGPACPICTGTILADHAHLLADGPLRLNTLHPIFLLPFAAAMSQTGKRAIRLTWEGFEFTAENGDAYFAGDPNSTEAHVTCERINAISGQTLPKRDRADLPAHTYAALDRFAQRTYAPATEASRLAGAGAGLTDND